MQGISKFCFIEIQKRECGSWGLMRNYVCKTIVDIEHENMGCAEVKGGVQNQTDFKPKETTFQGKNDILRNG